MLRVASIDIGIHNFALLIEDFNSDELSKIKNIPQPQKYDKNSEPTQKFHEILNNVYKIGKVYFMDKVNLTEKKKKFVDDEVLISLTNYLDSIENVISTCDIIVIEKQLQGKIIRNNIAKRIESHLESYLIGKYKDSKNIVIYPSSNKTKILGAPKFIEKDNIKKKMTKHQRKRWAEKIASDILLLRCDYNNYNLVFKSGEKEDDFSDTLVQLQSYKYKMFVNQTFKPKWTYESVYKFVKSKGGVLLDDSYINVRQTLHVKCKNNHSFENKLSNILNDWCLECQNNKLSIRDISKIVYDKYGGECLSEEYKDRDTSCGSSFENTKLQFKCKFDHEFLRTLSEIDHLWCIECSQKNIGKEICMFHFETLFGKKFNLESPKWLKNKQGNQMSLDGYNSELKIGFMYSGKQYYEFIDYYHNLEGENKDLDDYNRKRELCIENKINLIEVPYTIPYEDLKSFLTELLKEKYKLSVVDISFKKLDCYKLIDLCIQEIREIVSHIGYECLSHNYYASKTNLIFKCQHNIVFESKFDITQKNIKSLCKCKISKISKVEKISCNYVFSSGKNKGGNCSVGCKNGNEYCTSHMKIINKRQKVDILDITFDDELIID